MSLSAALPLLFVSPVGPRCLYASYLLTLAAAFSLLAESGLKPDFALPLCAGLCAAVLVFYTLSYLPLRRAVAAQETLLREAMDEYRDHVTWYAVSSHIYNYETLARQICEAELRRYRRPFVGAEHTEDGVCLFLHYARRPEHRI